MNTHKHLLLVLFSALSISSIFGQNSNPFKGFSTGYQIQYGGPAPERQVDSSSGTLHLGHRLFFEYTGDLNSKLGYDLGLVFDVKKFDYAFQFISDTIIKEPPLFFQVPYLGDVKGTAKTGSFEIYLGPNIRLFNDRLRIGVGANYSYNLTQIDTGTTKIIIGEGGLVIDSLHNNTTLMNHSYFGLYLKSKFYITKNYGLSFDVSRSLTPFYKDGMWSRIRREEVYFYNTYVKFGVFINF